MNLLSAKRASEPSVKDQSDNRVDFDQDFDRVLFSAPVRRLADKTQVFPMETNDSVRTRLTHSHEVSNLCRSLSLQILRSVPEGKPFGPSGDKENVPVIAAAAGLAHDLGNPPFGHQGEEAVREWFKQRRSELFNTKDGALSDVQQKDFLAWEGNAQAFRLVTKLQVSKGNCGLNLTFATLAALMKYTVASSDTSKKGHPARKKFGYFQDDKECAKEVLREVGLAPGLRHPIAYVMEACDDIAYSTIDVEDAINKGLVSLNDVLEMLNRQEDADEASQSIMTRVQDKLVELRKEKRSLGDTKDIALQYFRSFTIGRMVMDARKTYLSNQEAILAGTLEGNLIKLSESGQMCKALQTFARVNAFQSPKVTSLELRGANVLHGLMNYLWRGISETSLDSMVEDNDGKKRLAEINEKLGVEGLSTTFGRYAFNKISTNYRAVFGRAVTLASTADKIRYHQLLLLTDMVSGMTEDFVEATFNELRELDDKRDAK
ncbi:MAG: dGTP triphosphohydrolase [Hyphomonas sp.]|uniref:dGTP triphosphohydrolase n=2 Tax=Alphaproteobacteria TaxID=28211 RepID=UPI003264494D